MSKKQRGLFGIVIVSFIFMIITVISLLVMYWLRSHPYQHLRNCPVNRWSPESRNIYQHNGYWVISNYVLNQKWETEKCFTDITYAVQGDYKDIYKLEKLYNIHNAEWTSFAVYIPNLDYMIETRIAIAYVRHCSKNNLIRDFVSFHLYFLYDEKLPLDSLPLNNFEDFIFLTERNLSCSSLKNNLYTANSTASMLGKETLRRNNSVVVGKNIAQKEAHTSYILNGDLNYYPSYRISLRLELEFKSLKFEHGGVYIENLIWRMPVLLINVQEAYNHSARTSKKWSFSISNVQLQQIKGDPFNNAAWLKRFLNCYNYLNFSVNFEKFLKYKTFYIVDADFPLLDESIELTTDQSENLRMYTLKSLDYKYVEASLIYLVHTIDADDGISHNQFDAIDEKIRLEYEWAYDGHWDFYIDVLKNHVELDNKTIEAE